MNMLDAAACDYVKIAEKSVNRNTHMNNLGHGLYDNIPQDIIDALIVDFVNYIGREYQGMDYGMYTKHLRKD